MSAQGLRLRHPAARGSAADHRQRRLHRRHHAAAAWRTRRSCAARTRTRASAASTRRAAAAAPGVLAVYTGADTEQALKPLPCLWLMPNSDLKVGSYQALATDVVRYVGDAVAVVVAENAYQAQDARRSDRRRLRAAAGVTDPREGAAATARRSCTPTSRTTRRSTGRSPAATSTRRSPTPRSSSRRRIVQQRLIPTAMEPRAAVAQWMPATGELTLWNTTQNPHIAAVPHVGRHRRARRQAAGGRAGGRRRLRQQDRAVSGRVHRGVLLDEAGTAGQMDRDAQRELPGDDARPRSRAGGGAGRQEGRHDPRPARAPCGPAWARICRPRRPAFRRSCTA